MKRLPALLIALLAVSATAQSQYFFDDFESYTTGYLGPQSNDWTTWSGTQGTSEDADVVTTKAFSGSKSIYFYSSGGGGPQDVVLPFGGVKSSGRFKFRSQFYVSSGKAAYFNFQSGASPGNSWAMEFYMRSGGTFDMVSGSLTGTYPQDQWFELIFDVNLDNDQWTLYIDGVSKGTFTNTSNVSYLDVYTADANSEFWMDNLSYCVNSGCNPELGLSALTLNPVTVCSGHSADVTVNVKNNSNFAASGMTLVVDIGSTRFTEIIDLNELPGGKDTTLTVAGMLVPPSPGNGQQVKAINEQGDLNAANDTAKTTLSVMPSPTGSSLIKGIPFTSAKKVSDGTLADPDLAAPGDTLTYELTPPTGYANSGFGTTWTIPGYSYKTGGGNTISPSYFTVTNPSGSSNLRIRFRPDSTLVDTMVIISFKIVSSANGCDVTMYRYINVVPRPKASFTVNDVCDKQQMVFSNTSTIASGYMTHFWDFGDGQTSTLENPTLTYATFGSYTVKLYATSNNGYVDSFMKTVNVFELPAADFQVQNACEGTAVQFTDASTFPSGTPAYFWEFDDGNTSTSPNPANLYSVPDVYQVKLTITVNGCSNSISHFATQAPRAVLAFQVPTGRCSNEEIQFVNQTKVPFGTLGYTWDFGNGKTSSVKDPKVVMGMSGTVPVKLIARTDFGCVDSLTQNIVLNEAPVLNFTVPNPLCELTIPFTNTSTEPAGATIAYHWDFGFGNTSSSRDPVYSFSGIGKHTIKLSAVASNGCSGELTRELTILEKPVANFVANDQCEGTPMAFQNNSVFTGGLTYLWEFGNGDTSSKQDPQVTYGAAGTYQAQLIATTLQGCSDTVVKPVLVKPVPKNNLTAVASGNKGDGSMVFSANIPANSSYIWFFGDGAKETGTSTAGGSISTVYRYIIDGGYDVELHVTVDGCTGTSDTTISVNRLGTPELNSSKLNVYPNPSKGKFTVDLSAISEEVNRVEIFNASGQLVRIVAVPGDSSLDISLDAEAYGVYLVRVTTTTSAYSSRILVNNR